MPTKLTSNQFDTAENKAVCNWNKSTTNEHAYIEEFVKLASECCSALYMGTNAGAIKGFNH